MLPRKHSASLLPAAMGTNCGFQEQLSTDRSSSLLLRKPRTIAIKGRDVNKIKQPTELNWLETEELMTACEASPPSIHGRTGSLYTREEGPGKSICDKLRWPGRHLRHSDSAREELKSSQVSTSIWQNKEGGLWCTLGSSFAFAYCSSLFSLPRN